MRASPLPVATSCLADLGLLALGADESEQVERERAARLDQVTMSWPVVTVAHAFGMAVPLVVAALGGALTPALGVSSAIVLAVSLGVWLALVMSRRQEWPLHQRTRAAALAAGPLGAGLLVEIWLASSLATGPGQTAAVAALTATIALTGLALYPLRATMLSMAGGIILALAVLPGTQLAAAVCLVLLGLLAVVTCRLARLDTAAATARGERMSEGQLATRMIAEFETQGSGWFWEADRHGRLTYISDKVASAIAVAGASPLGQPLAQLFRMDADATGTERTLAFHVTSRTSFSDYSVCAARDHDGARWWSMSGRPVVDEVGRLRGFIGTGTDLTEQRRSEAEITRLALFDSLTGLANRQRLRLSLEKTLATRAGTHRATALFLLDLDRFKAVNDTLGHQAGDQLLKQVAQRLTRAVGDAGLVGRLGGDEFQVVLPGMDVPDQLAELARSIIGSLSQPYSIDGTAVTIGCSIGIAIARREADDAETIIRNADLALYAAKGDGRGVHRFYSDEMLAGAQSRKQLEDDLRQAIAEGGFHLAYQPVVSTRDAAITGYEALLRWNHPTRGAVSPGEFIPVAEDCGLIAAIGEWVMRTACREAAAWPRPVRVAVNVSPIQFASPAFPALVTSALAQSRLPPARLELEITEGVFLDETVQSDKMFKALKAIGVRLALDDFGTGYSSLGYLRSAPFDKIKIDQSFVRGAAQPGNRNPAIIGAIVTLARTLGMETTAEGVEVQDEIDLVAKLGCTHIQGYVYGKGVVAAEVARQLGDGGAKVTASGYRVSRAPRTRMLRSARIEIAGETGDVRIRDISSSGAMIDGIEFGGEAAGIDVLIELLENQMFPARIAWAKDGKAGMAFAETFNMERLHQQSSRVRRAG